MKPPTRAPFYAAMYHGLCETARKLGYALAIHGTVTTDLDLIAVPWTDEAVPAEELRDALMAHIGACDYEGLTKRQFPDNPELVGQVLENERKRQIDAGIVKLPNGAEVKPHGRIAWNLYMDHGAKVDLSVMPRALVDQSGKISEEIVDAVRALLILMGQLDPNCGAERHPEWPLQIRGDDDATHALANCLNRLQALTK